MSFSGDRRTIGMGRRSFLRGAAAALCATVAPIPLRAAPYVFPDVPAWCPPGWLPCDGRAVSRLMYPKLFAVIGETYGKAGATGFCLPGAPFFQAAASKLPARPLVATLFEHIIAVESFDYVPIGAVVMTTKKSPV